MKFIQELNESRLYRRLIQVDGKHINDIAERLFEHLLALQIMCNIDMNLASKYAERIMNQQQFDGFRVSQPDLFNLIVLVLRQEQYSHLIDIDASVGLPELRLRRNLRYIANGKFDNNDYSYMMLMLQRRFEKLPKMLIALRRQISDWENINPREHKIIIRRLLWQMREKGIQSDFYQVLSKLVD
jgi:hypothetical protein